MEEIKGSYLKNGVEIEYVFIPAGTFTMGQAYIAYNSLILSIFKDIFIPNLLSQKPEIIEMAIFSIAKDISTGFQ